jgi:hypothetical protein
MKRLMLLMLISISAAQAMEQEDTQPTWPNLPWNKGQLEQEFSKFSEFSDIMQDKLIIKSVHLGQHHCSNKFWKTKRGRFIVYLLLCEGKQNIFTDQLDFYEQVQHKFRSPETEFIYRFAQLLRVKATLMRIGPVKFEFISSFFDLQRDQSFFENCLHTDKSFEEILEERKLFNEFKVTLDLSNSDSDDESSNEI